MKVSLLVNPSFYVTKKAEDKMKEIVKQATQEIGWLGLLKKDDIDYILEDVFLFKQEVHSTTCELSPESIAEFCNENIDNVELLENLKLWGHSHVNMGVNPSSQDEKQFKELYKNSDYFARIIVNKKGEYRLDVYDKEQNIIIEDMEYTILYPDELYQEIKEAEDRIELLKNYISELKEPERDIEKDIKNQIEEKVSTLVSKYKYNSYTAKSIKTVNLDEKAKKMINNYNHYQLEEMIDVYKITGSVLEYEGLLTNDRKELILSVELEDMFIDYILDEVWDSYTYQI